MKDLEKMSIERLQEGAQISRYYYNVLRLLSITKYITHITATVCTQH